MLRYNLKRAVQHCHCFDPGQKARFSECKKPGTIEKGQPIQEKPGQFQARKVHKKFTGKNELLSNVAEKKEEEISATRSGS